MRRLTYMVILVLLVPACAKRDQSPDGAAPRQSEAAAPPKAEANSDEVTIQFSGASHIDSPASLLKANPDGSLLVSIKPHVYTSELGCTMMMDDKGNTFSQLHYVIAFSIHEDHYYSIWGVRFGKAPPVDLDRDKEYNFLVKPYRKADFKDESVPCEILKVWDGEDIVFERTKQEKAQQGVQH